MGIADPPAAKAERSYTSLIIVIAGGAGFFLAIVVVGGVLVFKSLSKS